MNGFEAFLSSRPRILNVFHRWGLAAAASQTSPKELQGLRHYSRLATHALEIGTFQGVSASYIASSLAPGGKLYCIDPWPDAKGRPNPCWQICVRHLRRTGVLGRVQFIRHLSSEVGEELPCGLDFAFVDGDHSWSGISTDWKLVCDRLRSGGIVCLHDTVVPPAEPWRHPDSVRYFEEVVLRDPRFDVIEVVHSMSVLRRK